jgi:hypothetical protein
MIIDNEESILERIKIQDENMRKPKPVTQPPVNNFTGRQAFMHQHGQHFNNNVNNQGSFQEQLNNIRTRSHQIQPNQHHQQYQHQQPNQQYQHQQPNQQYQQQYQQQTQQFPHQHQPQQFPHQYQFGGGPVQMNINQPQNTTMPAQHPGPMSVQNGTIPMNHPQNNSQENPSIGFNGGIQSSFN